ncbi:MAG: hypothetical protein KGS61_21330, partial [Verrucomicrobia bacterium]|nr:hypothetical protein [Verrucomicrobiota bacterium]
LLHLLDQYAPLWLAGILGAGIISAVMGSDTHQVLAVSTMFTKDLFAHYGGKEKYGERGSVHFARAFILVVTGLAYVVALYTPESIFELAVRFAFSGFAAMAPVMVAALFWKRSTKWGALAATLFVGASILGVAILQHLYAPGTVLWQVAGEKLLLLSPRGDLSVWGFMPVVPMVLGSALCVIAGSLLTPPPSRATLDKYFSTAHARPLPAASTVQA